MGAPEQLTEQDAAIVEKSLRPKDEPHQGPELISMDTVEAEEVSWLWDGLIPKGKLTIIEGNPGDGKTWLALVIAAAVSNGHWLPNPKTGKIDSLIEPGKVIYMTSEDGLADTIKPRLDAAMANHSEVYILQGNRDKKGNLQDITLENMGPIEQAIIQVKPDLLVIDPIQGYLGANKDMYRANEVRPLLAALAKLAEKYSFAAVCIRHLTKSNSSKAIYRGMGSIDFAAAARSILLVGRDPDRPDKRAIIQTKNSLGPMADGLGFTIDEGVFSWTGISDITIAGLLKDETNADDKSALDEAIEFLDDELSSGPVDKETLVKDARKLGISERTLRRAKEVMGITSVKPKGDKYAKWQWYYSTKE